MNEKKNKSSYLILPMLGYDLNYFDCLGCFVNCYIQDANYPEFNNHIVLLYNYDIINKSSKISKITHIENKLIKDLSSLLIYTYDPDINHTVFIYKVPPEHQIDYNYFMMGKYSKFSINYKNKILSFYKDTNIKGISGILNRDIIMLKNLHKNLGCMIQKCNCNHLSYINCNHFFNFKFDFNNVELWDKIDNNEILYIDINIKE